MDFLPVRFSGVAWATVTNGRRLNSNCDFGFHSGARNLLKLGFLAWRLLFFSGHAAHCSPLGRGPGVFGDRIALSSA